MYSDTTDRLKRLQLDPVSRISLVIKWKQTETDARTNQRKMCKMRTRIARRWPYLHVILMGFFIAHSDD